jgi:hypothetical protein
VEGLPPLNVFARKSKNELRLYRLFICVGIFVFFGAGCQGQPLPSAADETEPGLLSSEMETLFQEIIQVENINEDVKLTLLVPQDGEVKINSHIDIIVENISEKKLFFPVDSGIRFFTIQDSNWVEVQNTTTYAGYPAFLLSNDPNDIQASTIAGGFPDFTNITNAEFLRVVVIGEELTAEGEKTGIPVVGMIDLAINP